MVAWGAGTNNTGSYPYYGQSAVPADLSKVVAIAGGGYHSLALLNNGSPLLLSQPMSQTNYSGTTVTFIFGAVGAHPLVYQWQFNGTNIAGATNIWLILTNVHPGNVGGYSVIVSNAYGTATSSNAILNVVTGPPTIITQPTNQVAVAGTNVTFAVEAIGPVPMNYQ